MAKCLVTTLQGVAKATDLKKMNEIVFDFVERPNSNASMTNFCVLSIAIKEPLKVSIENGYFVDATGGVNQGTEITMAIGVNSLNLRVEEGTKLKIDNKYNITNLGVGRDFLSSFNGGVCKYIATVNSQEFRYLKNVNEFNQGGLIIHGDASDINGESFIRAKIWNPYAYADLPYNNFAQKLKGDGTNIISGRGLLYFNSAFSEITYNIEDFNPNILTLDIWDGIVIGDISNVEFNELIFSNLGYALNSKPFGITGNINKITKNNIKEHGLSMRNCPNISGNIGNLGSKCYYFGSNGITEFTYSKVVSRTRIMAMERVRFSSGLNQFLIDMAELPLSSNSSGGIYGVSAKTINVYGERTSSSDAAISTLKGKGMTVIINDVLQQETKTAK